MILTIHRGTHEIGGSCVQVQAQGKSILLDFGMPLVNKDREPFDNSVMKASPEELIKKKLIPDIPGLYEDYADTNVIGILFSHAHMDHTGLAGKVNKTIPMYMTQGAKAILDTSRHFLPNVPKFCNTVVVNTRFWPIRIGPFSVTFYPVDHSTPDAVAFLVEADGKRIFYTGDLRAHGINRNTFEKLVAKPPHSVDAMLMEGSTIGRDPDADDFPDETGVEERMKKEFLKAADNLVLVFSSPQNLDRLISVYNAARNAGRELVIDYYTVYLLNALQNLERFVPSPFSPSIRVINQDRYAKAAIRAYKKPLVDAIRESSHHIEPTEIYDNLGKFVMFTRENQLLHYFLHAMPEPLSVHLVYSLWGGYAKGGDSRFQQFLRDFGLHNFSFIHTSGHARVKDLVRLVEAVKPRALVPIHTFEPESYVDFSDRIHILEDGKSLDINLVS